MNPGKRVNADLKAAKHGTEIHIPVQTGAIKTVVVVILEESGKVHVSGPLNEPTVMAGLLNRARAVLEQYQQTRLVQPANGVIVPRGQG